ncbi:MAG: peptidoglycan DD-metalloendopeptidase family protein [Gemmatimonadales bacterium]|nr:peptidoglycan DD-metalloendopeptidase family protein [Gemmatimonadales bacterium]NIN50706.1 peptidoglycan DD-metalloendopeptidase family protein [Gemmatimonadales bacterium]NIP08170.1 peptidoglycan DD-metalloendopeptidase family protein [Gemmatimonadales bacterium]NIR01048.1 peptidoglycan DD-metalloendopeptidase family protein [Gemmatimonadales bacterium]NIS65127.1 peptidoglycan DD-metalloendopeptidase family protein [Gemmatimonadales bacterium]
MSIVRSSLLIVAGAVCLAAPAWGQRPNINRRIRDNQERLEAIRRERQDLESELERLRGQMHSISGELQNIERQKNVTSRIVNELDRQIGTLSAELDTVTLDLIMAQDALAEKRAVLRTRLVEIYKRGSLWIFEVLLAAESFGDLLSRYKYLYLVSQQDQALVSEVEELRDRVAQQRGELVSIRNEVGERRNERSQELDRYVTLERHQQQVLRQTRASERAATTRLDSLARDEAELEDVIATLERERRRALASGARMPTESTISDADLGSLVWPADGEILYRFGPGPGPDNTQIPYKGIGIGVPVNTPVRAVAAGTIEFANPWGTYGPTIMVHHGGFYTLYLYLSRFEVQPGQWVEAGDIIGRSGGANSDHGPHIEFQIRQVRPGGTAIALDPENWLSKRR